MRATQILQASLLQASLLQASLLQASLLQASLLQASLLQASLLQTFLLCGVLAASVATTAVAEPLQIGIAAAKQGFDPRSDAPIISFMMTPSSARAFAELTRRSVGRKIAIRIDGRVVMTPEVMEPISSGAAQISGKFTIEQAREVAAALASGTSKMEMEILPENGQGK